MHLDLIDQHTAAIEQLTDRIATALCAPLQADAAFLTSSFPQACIRSRPAFGDARTSQLITIRPAAEVHHDLKVEFSAAAPVLGSSTRNETHGDLTHSLSREVADGVGALPGLVLILRHDQIPHRTTPRVVGGHHDYSQRLPVVQDDDLGALAASFNRMQAGLAERQRLQAAFGTYVDPALAARLLEQGDDVFTAIAEEIRSLHCGQTA